MKDSNKLFRKDERHFRRRIASKDEVIKYWQDEVATLKGRMAAENQYSGYRALCWAHYDLTIQLERLQDEHKAMLRGAKKAVRELKE